MERKSPSVWLGPEKKLSAISFQLSAFSLWGRLKPQCHLVFPLSNICINCGADPLVRGRRPRRPVRGWMRLILLAKSGSRGTRADQKEEFANGTVPHDHFASLPELPFKPVQPFSKPFQFCRDVPAFFASQARGVLRIRQELEHRF